jgi:hypothetical protein
LIASFHPASQLTAFVAAKYASLYDDIDGITLAAIDKPAILILYITAILAEIVKLLINNEDINAVLF